MRLLGMLPTGGKELDSKTFKDCGWLQQLSAGAVEEVPSYILELLGLGEGDADHLRSVAFTRSIKLGSATSPDSQPTDLQPATFRGRAVFDTRKGYSIVYTERRITTTSSDLVDSTVSHLKNWGDFWYPERIVFEQKQNGDRSEGERLVVSQLMLNKREKFDTLKAMGIKPGSLVRGAPGVDGFFQWDGSKLVPVQAVPTKSNP